MDEIEIVIRDIPTRFIKTEKWGELDYNEVKRTIRRLTDLDREETVCITNYNLNILNWLLENEVIYFFNSYNGNKEYVGVVEDSDSCYDLLWKLYDKITEHERILDKLIGE